MAADQRLTDLQRAIREMRLGHFDLSLTAEGSDDVAKLAMEVNRLAAWLEAEYEQSQKLQQLTEEVAAGFFLDDVLDRIYETFRPMIPYDRIGCAMITEDGSVVRAYWARSDAPEMKVGAGFSAPLSGSSLETILHTGEPRTINDLEQYASEHPDSLSTKLMLEEGVRSSLTCPLIAQGKPVGFLFFSSREKDTYRHLHREVFVKIASQLSFLVEKSRLYQQLHEVNQRLLKAHEALERQATHDPLTQVLNRGAVIQTLDKEMRRARRSRRPLGIMMVDIDYFKRVNDRFGHLAADAVLKEVAARIAQTLRTHDHVGRYGGEEFLIILTDTHEGACAQIARRIRAAVRERPFLVGSQQVVITLSIGAVFAETGGTTPDRLIEVADQALYQAKEEGRDRVEYRDLRRDPARAN